VIDDADSIGRAVPRQDAECADLLYEETCNGDGQQANTSHIIDIIDTSPVNIGFVDKR
jgi:hypothetical protein